VDRCRRRGLPVPVRTVVLTLLSAATITAGTAAWAGQPPPSLQAQPGPTTTGAGPTITQPGPTITNPGPTITKPGPTTAPTRSTKPTGGGGGPPGPVPVTVTPAAGGPGTVVRVAADIRGCDLVHVYFYDRRSRGSGVNGGERPVSGLRVSGTRISATYTISTRDAVGAGRFGVLCNLNHEGFRQGYAAFQVRSGSGSGGAAGGTNATNASTDVTAQAPDQTDSGVAGTTATIGDDGGFNLAWLLLPAGLLLLGLAVWLGMRWRAAR
jgi:hypothetical protein